MARGAAGVDLLLLVVAADEGIGRQTEEHLTVARLLGIDRVVCAMTKIDRADRDTVARRRLEISGLVDAPIVPVSSVTGEGIPELRRELARIGASLPLPERDRILWIPIDRAFSRPGFGPVVTGTLHGSPLRVGDRLVLHPDRRPATVKGIEVFGERIDAVEPGSRVALNLAGVRPKEVRPGHLLSREGEVAKTRRALVRLRRAVAEQKPFSGRLRCLVGAADLPARLALSPSADELAELRFDEPTDLPCGIPVLIRSESPPRTLAGGIVVDPLPELRLQEAAGFPFDGPPETKLRFFTERSSRCHDPAVLARRLGIPIARLEALLAHPEGAKGIRPLPSGFLVGTGLWERGQESLRNLLVASAGRTFAEIKECIPVLRIPELLRAIVSALESSGEIEVSIGRIGLRRDTPDPDACVARVRAGGLTPPGVTELAGTTGRPAAEIRGLFARAAARGELIRLTDDLYISKEAFDEARGRLLAHFANNRTLDIARWKELVGVSRKYATPLLECFDWRKITLCRPDRTRIPGPGS
jgi:selenocysteine-specific elongation factor